MIFHTDTHILAELDKIEEGIRWHTLRNDMPWGRVSGFEWQVMRATGWSRQTSSRFVSDVMADANASVIAR